MILNLLIATSETVTSTDTSTASSTYISLIFSVITAFTAIASVVIANKTLKQNSLNIESSTRPYIKPYLSMTHVQTIAYHIVIKNFGASSAKITNLTTNIEWEHFTYEEFREPFKYIINTELPPGYKISTELAPLKTGMYLKSYLEENHAPLIYTIHIEYQSESGQKYSEDTTINMTYDFGLTHAKPHQPDEKYSLKMIANGIIDIGEKML